MNQDGKTQGISMPNGTAQAELIRSVYESAGLDVRDTGYVEAHGTGTKVGDPIEAAALYSAFGEGRSPREPLYIGSVKSNIGHTEGTSGIMSVIKTALMLEKGFILPNINFEKPNEAIPLAQWNMKVCTTNTLCFQAPNSSILRDRFPKLRFHGHGRDVWQVSIILALVEPTATLYLKRLLAPPDQNPSMARSRI
jgi:acyl transferase domain-containing protein